MQFSCCRFSEAALTFLADAVVRLGIEGIIVRLEKCVLGEAALFRGSGAGGRASGAAI
jgi:hypothetical protein